MNAREIRELAIKTAEEIKEKLIHLEEVSGLKVNDIKITRIYYEAGGNKIAKLSIEMNL